MIRLKLTLFCLLLFSPLINQAATITSYQSFVGNSVPGLTSYDDTGSTTVTTSLSNGFFLDLWTLTVGQDDIASIVFDALDVSPIVQSIATDLIKISPFNVTPGENSGYSNLTSGTYHFTVSGTTTGLNGGLYAVGTAVKAVPLPATVWLFGTVLFGFLSFSKHRHQL